MLSAKVRRAVSFRKGCRIQPGAPGCHIYPHITPNLPPKCHLRVRFGAQDGTIFSHVVGMVYRATHVSVEPGLHDTYLLWRTSTMTQIATENATQVEQQAKRFTLEDSTTRI